MHYPLYFLVYWLFISPLLAVEPEMCSVSSEEESHSENFVDAIYSFNLDDAINPTNGELANPNEAYEKIKSILEAGSHWYNLHAIELTDNGQSPILLQVHFAFLWMKLIHQFRIKGKVPFLKNAIRSIYKNDFDLFGVFLFWIGINTQEEKALFVKEFCKILKDAFPNVEINLIFCALLMNSEIVVNGMEEFFAIDRVMLQNYLDQYELLLPSVDPTPSGNGNQPTRSLLSQLNTFYQNPNWQLIGIMAAAFCLMHTKEPH